MVLHRFKSMAEKITIRILNRDYFVEDNGDPLFMTAIARYVEDKMREASERDNLVETSRVAVHAALTIAGELFKLREEGTKLSNVDSYRVDKLLTNLSSAIDNHS